MQKPPANSETQLRLLALALKDNNTAKWVATTPERFTHSYRYVADAIAFKVSKEGHGSMDVAEYTSYLRQQRLHTPSELASNLAAFRAAYMRGPGVKSDVFHILSAELEKAHNAESLRTKGAELVKIGDVETGLSLLAEGGVKANRLESIQRAADAIAGKNGKSEKWEAKTVTLTPYSTIKAKPIEWLFHNRIPLGKVTIFAGEGGTNKSTVAYDLAARVSSGALEPLSDTRRLPLGDCILVAGDDDPETDIVPRLELMGADTSRILSMDIRVKGMDGKPQKRTFDLSDIPSLREALRQKPNTKLVVIDPVSAFVGKKDANKHADVYSLVQPLGDLAAQFGVALILVAHTNKTAGATFRNKVSGSTAWTDAARACYLFTADKDTDRRYMSAGKMNSARKGKTLVFNVVEKPHQTAGNAITIDWEAEVDITADQLLQTPQDDGQKIGDAKAFLEAQLSGGRKVSSTELQDAAGKLGISKATLWRAKDELAVKSKKIGMTGGWAWYLDAKVPGPEESVVLTDEGSPF